MSNSKPVSAGEKGKPMDTIEYKGLAGTHISHAAEGALALSVKTGKAVHFEFNETHVTVQPKDTAEEIVARWQVDYDAAAKAYREHPDRIVEAEKRAAKDKAEREAHMIDTSANEAEMRDSKVPWPKTQEQLSEYIESLRTKEHDYGTCVYAMSMAATAAFYYIAGQLGVTGFQSGCADMDIIRRTRSIDGPFMLLKGEDALYPQYDLPGRLAEAMEEWKPWLKEQAEIKLREGGRGGIAHPDVRGHWEKLAAFDEAKSEPKR